MSHITFNNSVISCSNDVECPSNAVCLFESQQHVLNNSIGYYGCNPEAGMIGNLCSEIGPTGISRIIFLSIISFITFLLFLFVTRDLFRMFMNGSLKNLDVKVTTLIECQIGFAFIIARHLSGVAIYFEPFEVFIDTLSGNRKTSKLAPTKNIFAAICSFFLAAGVLNVGILWLQVAVASNKFKRIKTPQLTKNYALFVLAIDVFMIIAMGVCIFINPNLTGIVAAPFAAIISAVYLYSAIQISWVMSTKLSSHDGGVHLSDRISMKSPTLTTTDMSESSKKIMEALRRIQISTVWLLSAYLILTLLIVVSSILGSKMRRIYLPPQDYYIPSMFSDVSYFFISFALSSVVWYIHQHQSGETKQLKVESKVTLVETKVLATNNAKMIQFSKESSNADGTFKIEPTLTMNPE